MHNIAEKVLPELYSMFLTTRHLNSVLVKQELRPPQPRKKWKRGLETLQMRTLAYQ